MKKFLVLAALAGVLVASVANAQSRVGYAWVFEDVGFRTSRAAYAAPGFVDSMEFNRIGVGGTTMPVANAETTTVVSTANWVFRTWTAADSVSNMSVFIHDAGNTNSNVDSLHLAIQVSVDGSHWVYVNQVKDAAGANPITATSPAVNSWPLLNTAGSTTSTPKVFHIKFPAAFVSGRQYPDQGNAMQWPLIRFIIVNKTAGSYQHNFKMKVGHWTAKAD